jgi:hypothetical protein
MSNGKLTRFAAVIAPLVLAACASAPAADAPVATPQAAVAPATTVAPEATTAAPAADAATAAAPEPAPDDTKPPPPPGQKRYKWSKATEAEVAAVLDRKFREAAKAFVQLKRNDQVMFCKKYREMGSSIRTLHCITEAELRKQVEDSDQVRDQMRHKMGKCDITVGCGAGG